jgi:hypothetical protein
VTPNHRASGTTDPSPTEHPGGQHYQIRVQGRLSPRWSAWFDGLSVTSDEDGTTVITGLVVDQAALHGLLQKLRDVGITLVALSQVSPEASTNPDERN